jgi:hypothetical protein
MSALVAYIPRRDFLKVIGNIRITYDYLAGSIDPTTIDFARLFVNITFESISGFLIGSDATTQRYIIDLVLLPIVDY